MRRVHVEITIRYHTQGSRAGHRCLDSVPPRVIYPLSIITVHTTDRRWGVLLKNRILEMQISRDHIEQHQAEADAE